MSSTGSADSGAPHIHRPKVELFDTGAMTNTDPKGIVRAVDEYRTEPFGLFMARPMPGHADMTYCQTWLLPELGLRVSDWTFRPELGREQYLYLDVVDIVRDGPLWRTTDHYLDLLVYAGRRLTVLDVDELIAAVNAGWLDGAAAERALNSLHRAIEGLARSGYDIDKWLTDFGIALTWNGPDH